MVLGISGLFLLTASSANAYSRTRGYFRSSGTYVMPHFRTSPNATKFDNFSTKGNVNFFTGKKGYKSIWD